MDVRPGRSAELTHEVGEDDTASALGSGTVPVLGTPRLLAWAEEVTLSVLDGHLEAGETSVGTRVDLAHTAPSPVGDVVTVRAEVAEVDGSRVVFSVQARGAGDEPVGHGTIERTVVDEARFTARLRRG